ncbi:MAG TPA: amylo-alpha-1,6-glucosidase [Blastocatellia bacterium]|nr:amylo-alpha-1,6-glucosidase [Blastocatellia bacterium]
MSEIVRKVARPIGEGGEDGFDPTREWLVTNGLGGYASGTVAGALTRRFHGLLISALPAPRGREMMLNALYERILLPDGSDVLLGAEERLDTGLRLNGAKHLAQFELEYGLPVWRYEFGATTVEKRVLLPHGQNTTLVTYSVTSSDGPLRLELRPAIHFRPHEGKLGAQSEEPFEMKVVEGRYELCQPNTHLPPLKMLVHSSRAAFTFDGERIAGLLYRIEQRRGYDCAGDLWSPGYFHAEMSEGQSVTLVASTEAWEVIQTLNPGEARAAERERRSRLISNADPRVQAGTGAELVLAADQFIITPAGRVEDAVRARAAGDEVRTVVAGYHWFTDWGRDTMISLEGLTVTTGRNLQARYILRTFGYYVRDGLIPNMFPEGENSGLYHTADATLWFFHAISRYVEATGDRTTLRVLLPQLVAIAEHHLNGTRFGIGVDPKDGLLAQGAEGYQLTWMDAKVDGWVVTPRRGKAVEINALWYNALRLLQGWIRQEQGDAAARPFGEHADRAFRSFNERFWYEEGGYLYDVIDGEGGNDTSCRPNQVFAISLPNPILDRARWEPVFEVVRGRLLTPVGLRSLAPGDPDYKAKYDGDLRSRDAAYHQGTVWAWLVGPFVDAWLKLHPEERTRARQFLEGFVPHLSEACVGSISEIFDAESPFTPRGCVAQAWSIAEVLRCWAKTAE